MRITIDPQIAEIVLGHWWREKTVNDRYDWISDDELINAIDKIVFDQERPNPRGSVISIDGRSKIVAN